MDTKNIKINGNIFKICLVSEHRFIKMINRLKYLVENKFYSKSDLLRDRIANLGYFHYMPDKINTGNLLGHTKDKLKISYIKDNIFIEGYLLRDEFKTGNSIDINIKI